MTTNKPTVAAWSAGFWEGDGWAFVRKSPTRKSAYIVAGVTNTDQSVLNIFVDQWGGRLRQRNGTALSRKPVFEWRLESAKAEIFLRDIYPFVMGQKRATVSELLALRDQQHKDGKTHRVYNQSLGARHNSLIAAAPELLAALKMVATIDVDNGDRFTDEGWRIIRAAIAKAEQGGH